jgi:hypothetical protein
MIEDILDEHTPEIVGLTWQLRELIRSVMPDATERIYPAGTGSDFTIRPLDTYALSFPAPTT